MEKLIRFQHESEPNSVALFKAVSTPISCPQIFAGQYRGEDFNLVTDVGSRTGRHKRSLCSGKGCTANGTYHLGSVANVRHLDVSCKLLFMEGN